MQLNYGDFVKQNPELDNPKLRKNLRIITERFYKNTYKNGKTKYSISSSNLNFLNDYIQKNITEEELKAAMQILYKNQSNDGFYLIIETMEKLQSTLFKTTQQPQV